MDAESCDVAELECGEETGVGAQLLLLRVWGGGGGGYRGGGKMRSEKGRSEKGGSKERGVIIRTVGHESSSKPTVQPLFRPYHCRCPGYATALYITCTTV